MSLEKTIRVLAATEALEPELSDLQERLYAAGREPFPRSLQPAVRIVPTMAASAEIATGNAVCMVRNVKGGRLEIQRRT